MAVRKGFNGVTFKSRPPKKTNQGQGTHSRLRRRKKLRGQGRG